MDEITNYLNDPQLSEYLNEEENENPNPPVKKKRSFQGVVREVVMCHMREVEDLKENYKKGVDVLVKRYKAVKDEKLKLKSKVEYWSDECKRLQYENSKLLTFMKNGLCLKCENQMKAISSGFFKAPPPPDAEETAKNDHHTSLSDKSAEEGDLFVNEGNHTTNEGQTTSSDGNVTEDTSPSGVSRSRKLKLNQRSKRCRYDATSVKLRKTPSSESNKSTSSKRLPKGLSGSSVQSSTTRNVSSKNSPSKTRKSSLKSDGDSREFAPPEQPVRQFDIDKHSSEDDIVMESPKLKRLKKSTEPSRLVSPRLAKLKLTKEANRVFRRPGRVMKYKGTSNRSAMSPTLFDEGHELSIVDESTEKPITRNAVKETTTREEKSPHSKSVQSTPSPSVLSGNIPNFYVERKSGESSPKLKSRDKQKDDLIDIDQENADSPSTSKQKKLVQTKITHEMFMPPKTHLPNTAEFNSGVLTPSKHKDRESKELQEAIIRSLDDEHSKKDNRSESGESGSNQPLGSETCLESISAFTVPPLTSTPFVKEPDGVEGFKKPQIPKKAPTTPKSKQLMNTTSPRRSPRLNKQTRKVDKTTGSGNNESLPDLPESSLPDITRRQSKSRRTLEMDERPLNDITVSVPASKVNGSIDPGISLSTYETAPDEDDQTSRRFTRSQEKTPKSPEMQSPESDSLDLTCQSVVFGPPKATNAKSSNSKKQYDDVVESLEKSPTNVMYIPETMDVDGESDYEDAIDVDDLEEAMLKNSPERPKESEPSKKKRNSDIQSEIDNSFDVVQKDKGPDYAYADVVRKRREREQLKSYTCKECEAYFNADGAAGDNMRFCRHKARYIPPSTPEHFWDMTLPDTQIAQERGYLNITQGKASNFRRKRRLNKLFKSKDESDGQEDEDETL